MSRNARLKFTLLALLGGLITAAGADFYTPVPGNGPSRVVVVQGDKLLEAYLPNEARVSAAFNRGLLSLTEKTNISDAWLSLLKTNDVIGIKVFSAPGRVSGTRPAVVVAVVRGLQAAGVPSRQIVIWDRNRDNLRDAGYYKLAAKLGVRVASAVETGYDENSYYQPDTPIVGTLVWGDLEFGKKGDGVGRRSYITRILTRDVTKIISIAPLINENTAGLCGHFFSLSLGSVDNTRRFEGDPDRLAVALPEIYALPAVGDRVVLHVTDALLGQYQGGPVGFLQYTSDLNQLWLSHDPVALDLMALGELSRERKAYNVSPGYSNWQIYTNAVMLQLGQGDFTRIRAEQIR